MSAMAQEHERAAGAWQSEWGTLTELLALTGAAAQSLSELLGGLEVNVTRMRANLDTSGELVMTESVVTALGERLGRSTAQPLVQDAVRRAVSEAGRFARCCSSIPTWRAPSVPTGSTALWTRRAISASAAS